MYESYTIETFRNEIYNEIDMLRGNINRMNSATEIKELADMYEFAEQRLQRIHKLCLERLDKYGYLINT